MKDWARDGRTREICKYKLAMRYTLINQKSNLNLFVALVTVTILSRVISKVIEPQYFVYLNLIYLVGFLVSFILLINLRLRSIKLEFDRENMYLAIKGTENTVPLIKISGVSMTGVWMKGFAGHGYQYRINFINAFNEEDEIHFMLYAQKHKLFNKFVDTIRVNNPEATIKNWATNFDPLIYWFGKLSRKKKRMN